MSDKVKLQYNKEQSEIFSLHSKDNLPNRSALLAHLDFPLAGLKILDLGCGSGLDLATFVDQGAEAYGIDQAPTMVELAMQRAPKAKVVLGDAYNLPFQDGYFDVVFSKYFLWHCEKPDLIYQEAYRVLKNQGCFLFLTCHPMREFLDTKAKNYFQQEEIATTIFNGKVTLYGYSHCLQHYLSPYLLSHFKLEIISEGYEELYCSPFPEWVCPGYLIAKLTKQEK